MENIYEKIMAYSKKYPTTVAWRKKAHASIIEKHLNPGEKVLYALACQKNFSSIKFFNTYAVALTNKRILLAQKRIFFGYTLLAITPDMFNDLTIKTGVFWGKAYIDTVKEVVVLSNLAKDSVPEIETAITQYMMEEKKKYRKKEENNV